MTKKKQKPVKKVSTTRSADRPVQKSSAKEHTADFQLILFDKKALIYIIACVLLFFIFVALKWHNSSIGYWNHVVKDGGNPDRGVLAGRPLTIRSDEWMVLSSFILAQHANGFPVANEALGYGKTPLMCALPTQHVVSKIKPVFWGFYLFDIETAYSWFWNFKIFPFLIASFLLLMLFSGNNFLLSMFGSIWLLLSSAIQWWSINTELFTWGCVAVISFIYVLYAVSLRTLVINGVLLIISSWSFAMVLYPAYQVPLAYFLLALIIGFIVKNKQSRKLILGQGLNRKIVTLGFSLAVLACLFYLFYDISKDTIGVISNTVYPGKRNEGGGDFSFLKMFTDNFSLFMTDSKFPSGWGNICELSSFLMVSPVASILILADFIKTRKANPLLISVIVFQLVIICWLFMGFPEFLAKISLFHTSPSYRAFYIFGFANVIATILFIAHHRSAIIQNNIASKLITLPLIFLISYGVNYMLNKQAGFFFTTSQVIGATAIFGGLNWLAIHAFGNKIFRVAFVILCFFLVLPNIKINPLNQGLSPYYENAVFKTVSEINARDPGAGWVVFGQFTLPNFLKAAGINCFNGVQFAPPLKKLEYLDRTMKNDSIYNRYAHIAFISFIDGKDSVEFALRQNDLYTIRMDPCSPRLYQLGIKYFMFTYEPTPVEVEYMTYVKDIFGYFIYKRNEI